MSPIALPHGEFDLNAAEVRIPFIAATSGQPVTRLAIAERLGVHNVQSAIIPRASRRVSQSKFAFLS